MTDSSLLDMDPARIARYKSRFHKHSLRLVQMENFLHNSVADQVSGLLKSQAKFGPIYGLHKPPGHVVDREEWLKSDRENRFFHYEMLAEINGRKLDKNALKFLKLRQFLSSDAFCELARQITDEAITSVTKARVHRLRKGHYLRPHSDRSGARKIAYILYLSPDWGTQFGGQLTLTGHDGVTEKLEPAYNSMILFDVTRHKEHYIEPITEQSEGWARDTMSGWLLGHKECKAHSAHI